jgi:hypothetical protein
MKSNILYINIIIHPLLFLEGPGGRSGKISDGIKHEFYLYIYTLNVFEGNEKED